MKFTIDIEEFWVDEGEGLSEALTKYVTDSVVSKIKTNIEDRVNEAITTKVTAFIEKELGKIINKTLSQCMDSGKIKNRSYGKEEFITITEHVKYLFQNNHGWNSPEEKIAKIGKKFGEDFKARYDMIFANEIVKGLKEQGMLKDEVLTLLLENHK